MYIGANMVRVICVPARPPDTPDTPDTPDRPSRPPDKDQTGVDWLSTVNLTYRVHVGCHLDFHVVVQLGADV
jgi:hypothetical protein